MKNFNAKKLELCIMKKTIYRLFCFPVFLIMSVPDEGYYVPDEGYYVPDEGYSRHVSCALN